jgi:hypothetical protein
VDCSGDFCDCDGSDRFAVDSDIANGAEPRRMKLDELFVMIMFVSTALFSSSAAAFQEQLIERPASIQTAEQTAVLFENVVLRSACAVGAVLGALLSILLFPCTTDYATREMAAKFLASMVSGVLFTPIVIRWGGIAMDLDHVVAVAGGVSFLSVTVLHKSLPMIESTVGAWFQRVFERLFGK